MTNKYSFKIIRMLEFLFCLKIFYCTTRVISIHRVMHGRNIHPPRGKLGGGGREASLIRDGVYVIKAYVTGSRGCTSPEDEI